MNVGHVVKTGDKSSTLSLFLSTCWTRSLFDMSPKHVAVWTRY